MTENYYLLKSHHQNLSVGTVFLLKAKKAINIETNQRSDGFDQIKSLCTQIDKFEADYLVNNKIDDRINLHNVILYLKQVKIGAKCFWFDDGIKQICTILDTSKYIQRRSIKILTSIGQEKVVPLSEVDVPNDAMITKQPLSSVNTPGNSIFFESSLEFVKERYLNKKCDIANFGREESHEWKDKLVSINDDQPIFGKVRLAYSLSNDYLLVIEILADFLHRNHMLFTDILFDNIIPGKSVIVVQRKFVRIFDEPLPYRNDSCFIDIDGVKFFENYESNEFRVNDIIKYNSGKVPSYGQIRKCVLLNNDPCIGLAIPGNETNVKYVRESDNIEVIKHDGATALHDSSEQNKECLDDWECIQAQPSLGDRQSDSSAYDNKGMPVKNRGRNNGKKILLDELKATCSWRLKWHKKIVTLNDKIVVSSICCVAKCSKSREDTDINVYSRVINGSGFIVCRWIGKINGQDAIGFDTTDVSDADEDENTAVYINRSSIKIALFKTSDFIIDRLKSGVGNNPQEYKMTRKPSGTKNMPKKHKSSNSCEEFMILSKFEKTCISWAYFYTSHDKIVLFKDRIIVSSICCVENDSALTNKFGINIGSRVIKNNLNGCVSGICRWIGKINGRDVIGVEMENCSSDYFKDKDTMVFLDDTSIKIALFESAEFRTDYEREVFSVDDIVTSMVDGKIFYGKIVKVDHLNNVRHVRVINANNINDNNDEKLFREDRVSKITGDESVTKYIDKSIIDPRSIVTLSRSNNNQFHIGDGVEFICSGTKYEGNIYLIVDVNMTESVIVELNTKNDNNNYRDLWPLRINAMILSENFSLMEMKCYVAVVWDAIKIIPKKMLHCTNNGIAILNPSIIETVKTHSKEDRIIIFKINGKRIVATLKWRGSINDMECIGCELKYKSEYGTNGIFGINPLFKCKDGCGALIPLADTEECCAQPIGILQFILAYGPEPHAEPTTMCNDRIVGSTICCVEQMKQSKCFPEITLGARVMKMAKNVNIFGICHWLGMVNGKEVMGVEMKQCGHDEFDKYIDELQLFDDPYRNIQLFLLQGFIVDTVGLCYCSKNKSAIVDINGVKITDEGKSLNKTIIRKKGGENGLVNIKWEGIMKARLCVGYDLDTECDCGTNGIFDGKKLFECIPGRGVLSPANTIDGSCLKDGHTKVVTNNDGSLDQRCVCCFEPLTKIKKWPSMETGSKLMFKSNLDCQKQIGNCKWMGRVNGVECVGANMKQLSNEKLNTPLALSNIFECKDGRGVILLADDIVHDVEGEKLLFVMDKFVNVRNLWKVQKIVGRDTREMKIGDYVCTSLNGKRIDGELKWMGVINNIECVGMDLEDECDFGMNGIINDKHKFDCVPRHGVVTLMDNIQKYDIISLKFTNDGMIDPNKYLRCKEKWNKEFLKDKNVSKDGLVFVIINNDGRIWKKKGILRWCGIMNDVSVAVVELDKCYDYGTNGRFWRYQLIQCEDKKAIAVELNNVFEYIPFERKDIPDNKKIFKQISMNSSVLVYIPQRNTLKGYYGTVRWTGINEFDEYLYGIELDDRYSDGSDGEFMGQRLFKCQKYYGILVPICEVTPDERFIQLYEPEADVPMSQISNEIRYCNPTENWAGENYGIQGIKNSYNLATTIFALFSKSDALDFMLSPMINAGESLKITKQFRDIIASQIVYPLRKFGFVSFHRIKKMQEIIIQYGATFEEMMKHEMDMENIAKVLAMLTPSNQLLRLTPFEDSQKRPYRSMFHALIVTLTEPVVHISTQQMLEISMARSMIMFTKPPTCLIMQAPSARTLGINCYKNLLPSKVIEISNLCYLSYKKCVACSSVAAWQCKSCVERKLRMSDALFCDKHKCVHEEIMRIPDSTKGSKSEVQMILKSIICIENAHFVSYVKEDEFSGKWVFFDSMSTQSNAMTSDPLASNFLNLDETSMKTMLSDNTQSSMLDNLKRITKHSYIFVYHNTAKTCY